MLLRWPLALFGFVRKSQTDEYRRYLVCYFRLGHGAGDRSKKKKKTAEERKGKTQHNTQCIIFIPKPSNGARNDECASKTRGEKYYWCCDATNARAHQPGSLGLNYLVLVFIGAFDMMRGNSCSFDFYCSHAHTHRTHQFKLHVLDDATSCPSNHTWASERVSQRAHTHNVLRPVKFIYPNLFIKTDNIICKWFFSPFCGVRVAASWFIEKSFTWLCALCLRES